MSKNNKNLNWDAFRALGSTDGKSESMIKSDKKNTIETAVSQKDVLRVFLDKKKRRGKVATIIKGFQTTPLQKQKEICKELKTKCGVGGTAKEGEIIIQGNQRVRVIQYLIELGYKNVKASGG